MADIAAFCGIRFSTERFGVDISAVVAPPYDVLGADDKAALLAGDAHNVVVEDDRAYWAWYYNGIRVVEFSDCDAGDGFGGCTPTEVAHFGGGDFGAAEPATNFWGVYLHTMPETGTTYILGSDRNGGLWIFDDPTP